MLAIPYKSGVASFMLQKVLTFDELPGAVSSLVNLVRELANEVRELRAQLSSERSKSKSPTTFIGMPDASSILGKARPTVYRLAQQGKIPAYKNPDEKEWRFIEDELVAHVKGFKKESSVMSFAEMEADICRGTRVKSLKAR
ncbi:MAG: helix-turn-helix domain-containing protein [bacterium]|nr:helix-turn-helix domain-containing protein [bacterium]